MQEVPWWLVLLWGILSVIFGFLLLTQPFSTAIVLLQVMAIYWVIGGAIDIVGSVLRREGPWVWRLIAGVVSVIAGLFVLGNELLALGITVQLLFIFLAVGAIIDGIVNIVAGFQARWAWGALILGILQLLVGIWLIANPLVGFASIVVLIPVVGVLIIIGGVISIIMAFRLR